MRSQGVLMALAFAVVSMAGCSGGSSGSGTAGPDEDLSATHGTIVGLVTDDEARPLEEVAIGLRTVKASPITIKILTSSEGKFRIESVAAGRQTLVAEKAGYNEVETSLTVLPGTENQVRFVLTPRPIEVYEVLYKGKYTGHYDCAVEAFVTSGSCDYEVKNNTGQAPLATRNNHSIEVPPGWGGVLFEVTWTTGTVQATMEGIRFRLESQEDLGGAFLNQYGTGSSMRIAVNAGDVAPDATLGYPIPQRGTKTWMHVLPLGKFDGATCPAQCGSGLGLALSLDYEVHYTVFFGGPVDPNYSALQT